MSEFSKLNGFEVKDKTARSNHAALVEEINTLVTELNAALEDLESKINSGSGGNATSCECDQIPFVKGTQTTTTSAWTGVASTLTELKDGQTIRYWLPYSSTGAVTLNLTLSNGTTTGAINCYLKLTTRISTQFIQGSMITLTYRENVTIGSGTTKHTGWWASGIDDTDRYVYQYYTKTNDLYRLLFAYGSGITGESTYSGHTQYCNTMYVNPSTGELFAPIFVENGIALSDKYALKSEIGTGGGGDSVSFTQSLTSGTQIGTITINGTGTPIYAPTVPTVPTKVSTSGGGNTAFTATGTSFSHITIAASSYPRVITVFGTSSKASAAIVINNNSTAADTTFTGMIARTYAQASYYGQGVLCCTAVLNPNTTYYIHGRSLSNSYYVTWNIILQ